jgi:hypothetical protein
MLKPPVMPEVFYWMMLIRPDWIATSLRDWLHCEA